MLVELSIRNFAIIDQLRIEFDRGMNAITGETGAGKSIIIDALGAVLGDRIGADVVRSGESSASVEAIFDLANVANPILTAALDEFGIELDDETLILARQISSTGRSSARVNGITMTIGQLSQIGSYLIDIHGQSDHLKLLRSSTQLDALDHYAGTIALRGQVRDLVCQLEQVRTARNRLRGSEREREQRIDLLRFQIDEISSATLKLGEDEQIARDRAILANAEHLAEDAARALESLESEDGLGATMKLRTALIHIQRIAEIDVERAGLVEQVNEVVVLSDDLISELRRYLEAIDVDADRLTLVDDRLDLINGLKRKYGSTIEEIVAHLDTAQVELDQLTGATVSDESLAEDETRIVSELSPAAAELSEKRRRAASNLEVAVDAAIAELGLGSAQVRIALTQVAEPSETGADAVEFLFAPNQGEVLKPLARIASGGETARLMLALKSVIAEGDQTPTLVFDEVDVGVGARSGQAVGEKLWSLASRHQVLVISHLAQIAAFADTHFMIEKDIQAGRTISTIERLNGDRRLDELAEMIDGKPVSPESRAAADQLMERISAAKRTAG